MNATETKNLAKGIENWIRVKGIRNIMRRTAQHLLPGKKFNFILNVGGGSYTDGKKVVVGVPELTFPMSKEVLYSVTKALTGHETEHVWSSDFDVFVQFQKDVKAYFKKHYNLRISAELGRHMLNSTEDGRIENRLVNRYPGYKKHIQLLNGIFWDGQACQGKNEMTDFLYSFTSMCVTGLKAKEWEKHYEGTEADEMLDQMKPLMMKAIKNPSAKGCAEDTMELVELIAPYMAVLLEDLKNQEALKEMPDMPDFQSNSPQEGEDSQPGTSNSAHFLEPDEPEKKESGDSTDEEEGENTDEEGDESTESKSKSKSKEDEEGEDGEDEKDSEDGSTGDSDDENEDESKEESAGDSDEESDDENPEDGEDEADSDENKDGESDDSSDDKDEDSKDGEQSDDKELPDESESDVPENKENGEEEDESPKPTPEEIEQLIQDMIENLEDEVQSEAEQAMEQGEKEAERERQQEERENVFTGHLVEKDMKGLDKGVDFRQTDPVRKRTHAIPPEVLQRGRLINKELRKVFLNKQSYTSRNRRNGQLDMNSLWKKGVKDYNMFQKKGVPNDSSYVVNVLVDASGSMMSRVSHNSQETKLTKATEATAMIEEGLRDLVPVRITYFTSLWSTVLHSTVKDFNQSSKETLSWNRLPAVENAGNRDGYSIKIATREILKRPEQKKILIILSDGLPVDPNQSIGQREVMEAVREARQAGVIVIAIAFGSEQEMENNKNVYKEMYQKGIIMVRPDEIHKYLSKTIQNEIKK